MRFTQFGTLALSQIDAEDVLDTPPVISALLDTVAGPFDAYGTQQARNAAYSISRIFALHGTTTDDLDDARDDVRSRLGTYNLLWAYMGDGFLRWTKVRLMQIREVRSRRNFNFQPVRMEFELLDSLWQGKDYTPWVLDAGILLDAGEYLDETAWLETMSSSPHTITVTNGGNRRIDNPVITITAGSADITALTIAKTGETDMDFGVTISSGLALVIDCGAMTIENNGANSFSSLTLASGHVIPEWLRLDPGDNDIDVTFTGGSTDSTVQIEFRDRWA